MPESKDISEALKNAPQFAQISDIKLVNFDRFAVREIILSINGDIVLVVGSGDEIRIPERYCDGVLKAIGVSHQRPRTNNDIEV